MPLSATFLRAIGGRSSRSIARSGRPRKWRNGTKSGIEWVDHSTLNSVRVFQVSRGQGPAGLGPSRPICNLLLNRARKSAIFRQFFSCRFRAPASLGAGLRTASGAKGKRDGPCSRAMMSGLSIWILGRSEKVWMPARTRHDSGDAQRDSVYQR